MIGKKREERRKMLLTVDDDFDLEKIADSGQCFRWEPRGGDCWRVVHGNDCLYIAREFPGEYTLSCTEEEFRTVWRPYFDLDTDYAAIRRRIDPEKDAFLYAASESGKGIRILRQDPWEITVSFLISQNRSIGLIRRSVETLCRLAGTERRDCRGEVYHTFPGPEAIAAMSAEDLAPCRLGYRDKYVLAAAKAACGGSFSIARLRSLEDEALLRELQTVYGIGPKVASCIALFGFHRLNAFPADTWIKKALEKKYPAGFPWEEYRPYSGVYQQYIFAYCRASAGRSTY